MFLVAAAYSVAILNSDFATSSVSSVHSVTIIFLAAVIGLVMVAFLVIEICSRQAPTLSPIKQR